jgi:hypothetical protein
MRAWTGVSGELGVSYKLPSPDSRETHGWAHCALLLAGAYAQVAADAKVASRRLATELSR